MERARTRVCFVPTCPHRHRAGAPPARCEPCIPATGAVYASCVRERSRSAAATGLPSSRPWRPRREHPRSSTPPRAATRGHATTQREKQGHPGLAWPHWTCVFAAVPCLAFETRAPDTRPVKFLNLILSFVCVAKHQPAPKPHHPPTQKR